MQSHYRKNGYLDVDVKEHFLVNLNDNVPVISLDMIRNASVYMCK